LLRFCKLLVRLTLPVRARALHRATPSVDPAGRVAPGRSFPAERLRGADVTAGPVVAPVILDARALVCEKARYGPNGHLYASVGGDPVAASSSVTGLADLVSLHRAEQQQFLPPGDGLDAILGSIGRVGVQPIKGSSSAPPRETRRTGLAGTRSAS